MSWLSSAFKSITSIAKVAAPIIGGIVGGPVGAAIGGIAGGAVGGAAPRLPSVMPGGAPLGLPQLPGLAGIAPGQLKLPGFTQGARTKAGRLTGQQIPRGFVERMSKTGVVYLSKLGRRRGLSGRDLSNFRRVSRILSRYAAPAARYSRRRPRR